MVMLTVPVAWFCNRYAQLSQTRDQIIRLGGALDSDGVFDINGVYFSQSNIDDVDLRVLEVFSSLREIRLNDTLVTDDCVETLSRLRGVEFIDLRHTQLTGVAVQSLTKRFPSCKIVTDSTVLTKEEEVRYSRMFSCPRPECYTLFTGSNGKCPRCGTDASRVRHPMN